MRVVSVTVGVPVGDVTGAVRWYERVFAFAPGIEPVPRIREFEVSPGCWLQLFEGEPSGSEHVFRIGVEDLEGERLRLLNLGVAVGGVERVEGVIAYCDLADPYGNRLSLYQVLS